MANPKHVALVRKGADAIAEWRKAHPRARLNLSGADFFKADLSGANLRGADLSSANLTLANFSGANLSHARFSGANFFWTNFRGADLGGANLSGVDLSMAGLDRADLSGADLSGANLRGTGFLGAFLRGANLSGASLSRARLGEAILSWADLSEADLSEATLWLANLTSANLRGANLGQTRLGFTALDSLDLSGVKGLTDVFHDGPSSIGVDTLIASFRGAGNKLTPELTAFFRSAGVPQELLDALPKIVSEIKYYSCFISYGQPDLEFAKKLCEDLKAKDVDCWFYPHDKTIGEDTQREIAAARRRADKMIVVCSVAGLMRDGLLKEIEDQEDEDPKKLMPVSLDLLWREQNFRVIRGARDLKPLLLLKNYGYFALWESNPERYQKGLEDVLKGLKRPATKKAQRKKG